MYEGNMKNNGLTVKTAAGWKVCDGGLFLDGEEVPVHREVVRLVANRAGIDSLEACGALSETDVRRIFFMERALLKVDLAQIRGPLGRTA
jgi:hypothetical protein